MKKFISILHLSLVAIICMAAETNFVPFSIEHATERWVIGTGKEAIKYSAFVGAIENDTCVVIDLFTKRDITFDEKTSIETKFSYPAKNRHVISYLKESYVKEGGYRLIFKVNDDFIYEWNALTKDVMKGEYQSCIILNSLMHVYTYPVQ